MAVNVNVQDDHLDIDFTGVDRWMALKGHLELPFTDIAQARVIPATEARGRLRWRVGGGSWPWWPGPLITGHYTVNDRPGARELWCVYRDPEVLDIETRRECPSHVVLQTPDRERLAWWINERVPVG
jgi:hypothetical protein